MHLVQHSRHLRDLSLDLKDAINFYTNQKYVDEIGFILFFG